MKVISHRGANQEYPENTLSAFERALELGVDALEADLHLSKDLQIIIRHDDLIHHGDRWHFVKDLTFSELEKIDLGEGATIPLLEEFLERFSSRCPLVLDFKCFGLAEPVMGLLRQVGLQQTVHVTSFLHSEIYEIREGTPGIDCSITLASIPMDIEAICRNARTDAVSLFRGYLSQKIVHALDHQGIRVRAFPVNLQAEAQKLDGWGVKAIYTDDPSIMKTPNSS